jgi:formate-dependent nitrite reductase membrane component NrfD
MNPAVWTWEIPLYFWFGGIAAGSSFVALACDLSGDHRSARIARRVALAALMPSPPLLVMDLGRPARFLNMLRIFKPRSPMSMGAWCLTAFGGVGTAAVAADLVGRPREARVLGGANEVLGGYLGSYTGVLLASTAVPLWARSRMFLGPIFVTTAVATGAAATRLVLVAAGLPDTHRTRHALGRVETGAIAVELAMSSYNEYRLGEVGDALERGCAGQLFQVAKWSVRTGLALRAARPRFGTKIHHVASALYLTGGLAFRYAWVAAGHNSATDDKTVAWMARHHEGGGADVVQGSEGDNPGRG